MDKLFYIFKRPDLIAKGEPFLEGVLGIPGAGHYTPNLAQEINLSRIQRQINVDRVSIRKGAYRPAATQRQWAKTQRYAVCSGWNLLRPFTNTDSYSRCFRYLDCFRKSAVLEEFNLRRGGEDHSGRDSNIVAVVSVGVGLISIETLGVRPLFTQAVSITRSLDRNLKDNQGGCLYEWPTYNQNQALTTPVNLVGGAVMRTIPVCREVPLTTL